jgi:predicted nuclease of restriction endonuclease-like RecB superfamily
MDSPAICPAARVRLLRGRSLRRRLGPEPRDGWHLSREDVILHHGQQAFFPDFVLRKAAGEGATTEVYLEIVGFWTEKHLAQKRQTLTRFHQQGHCILIAVARRSLRDAVTGEDMLVYRTRLKVPAVLDLLNARPRVPAAP